MPDTANTLADAGCDIGRAIIGSVLATACDRWTCDGEDGKPGGASFCGCGVGQALIGEKSDYIAFITDPVSVKAILSHLN